MINIYKIDEEVLLQELNTNQDFLLQGKQRQKFIFDTLKNTKSLINYYVITYDILYIIYFETVDNDAIRLPDLD